MIQVTVVFAPRRYGHSADIIDYSLTRPLHPTGRHEPHITKGHRFMYVHCMECERRVTLCKKREYEEDRMFWFARSQGEEIW